MKTPEQILDEVAVLNMKNVQQMVCTKELVIKAMRLYAKAYYEREMQEHKEVIKQLLVTYITDLNDNGSPKASINDILQLIDKAKKLIK